MWNGGDMKAWEWWRVRSREITWRQIWTASITVRCRPSVSRSTSGPKTSRVNSCHMASVWQSTQPTLSLTLNGSGGDPPLLSSSRTTDIRQAVPRSLFIDCEIRICPCIQTFCHSLIWAWNRTIMWSPSGKVWSPKMKNKESKILLLLCSLSTICCEIKDCQSVRTLYAAMTNTATSEFSTPSKGG